jgi:hypothetical protein
VESLQQMLELLRHALELLEQATESFQHMMELLRHAAEWLACMPQAKRQADENPLQA